MFQNVCSKKILVEQAKSLVLFYVRFAQVCPCVVVTVVGVVCWGIEDGAKMFPLCFSLHLL